MSPRRFRTLSGENFQMKYRNTLALALVFASYSAARAGTVSVSDTADFCIGSLSNQTSDDKNEFRSYGNDRGPINGFSAAAYYQSSAYTFRSETWLKFDGAAIKAQLGGNQVSNVSLGFLNGITGSNYNAGALDVYINKGADNSWQSYAGAWNNQVSGSTLTGQGTVVSGVSDYVDWASVYDTSYTGPVIGRSENRVQYLGTQTLVAGNLAVTAAAATSTLKPEVDVKLGLADDIMGAINNGENFTLVVKATPTTTNGPASAYTRVGVEQGWYRGSHYNPGDPKLYMDDFLTRNSNVSLAPTLTFETVPEPAPFAIFGLGLLAFARKRNKRNKR